jgi:hypothetical protein
MQSILVAGARIMLPSKLPRVAKNTLPSKRGIFWRLRYEPGETEAEARRFFELVSQIAPQPKNIVELFGGVGVNAQILQLLFNPNKHEVYSNERRCYAYILEAGRHHSWSTSIIEPLGGAQSVVIDSLFQHPDLVVADFPDWTLSKAKRQYRTVTEAVFDKAAWVVLTDSRRLPALEMETCFLGLGYRLVAQSANKRSIYLLFRKAS